MVPMHAEQVEKHCGQIQRLLRPFSSCTMYVPQTRQLHRITPTSEFVFYHDTIQDATEKMRRTQHLFKRILPILLLLPILIVGHTDGESTFEPIQNGDNGESVVRVQERLFDLGYYSYKPTGSFRTVTRNAVLAFQTNAGLEADGSLGIESYSALFSHSTSRTPFHASVPVGYTAQGAWLRRGTAQRWEVIKTLLIPDSVYTITNAQTGTSVSLLYIGGENHAEFQIPLRFNRPDADTMSELKRWLGSTDSYYKCGVLLRVEDQSIAASIQWNGDDHVCLYTTGSTSHVFGLEDVEHAMIIERVAGGTGA